MRQPLFSIIMPTYNRACVFCPIINALLAQSITDFELIIVDDGSTDNTLEILSSYDDSRIKVLYQNNNRQTQARRKACNEAKGKYFAFCDSDDIWDVDYLKSIHLVFAKYNADFVFTNYIVEGEKRPRIDLNKSETQGWLANNANLVGKDIYHFIDLYAALSYYQPIFCSCQALSCEHYRNIGGISKTLNNLALGTIQTSEDSHIIRRSAITQKAYFINQVRVKLGRQGDNMSGSYTSNLHGGLNILLDLYNNYNLSEPHKLITKKAIRKERQALSKQIYYFESSANYIKHYRSQPKIDLTAKNHAHFFYLVAKNFFGLSS